MKSKTYPKPASESLKQAVREIIGRGGKAYAEIPHPDFSDWPSKRKATKRQDIIEPHLEYRNGTALDIGAYFGAFSHWLEDLGYRVTAVERNRQCVAIAKELRDLSGKTFEVYEGSYHEMDKTDYDLVLALNVFYQSLKRPETLVHLEAFLPRLNCRMMIFESHDPSTLPAMEERPSMTPDEFVQFIGSKTGLSDIQEIGTDGPRKLYKLKRPPSKTLGIQSAAASNARALPREEGHRAIAIASSKAKVAKSEHVPPPPAHPPGNTKTRPPKEAKPPLAVEALALLLDEGVEKLVGEHLGCKVRHIEKKEHIRPKVLQSKRRYFKHLLETVETSPRQFNVFSKSGIGAPHYLQQVEAVLSNVRLDEFRAPRFYGVSDLADGQREGRIAVWEFVSGQTFAIPEASRDVLHQMARAAAGITTVTEEAKRGVPRLRDSVKFVKPLAEKVEAALDVLSKLGTDTTSQRPLAERFAAHEERVLARLGQLGSTSLCHMDFGNTNVVFPVEAGPAIVIDWESACLGPPASTLRKLAVLPPDIHEELANVYVNTLKSLGRSVDVRDALFAMRAVQVYYSLDWGCRRDPEEGQMVERAISWGLAHLDYLEIP